jgi:hypothetical protein
MILAAAVAAHFYFWREAPGQIGVSIGKGRDAHLILLVPREGCSAGVKVYSGRYGDLDAATHRLAWSKACAESDRRGKRL